MKIAIPTNAGRLSMHFGHCEKFAIVEADAEKKEVVATKFSTPPVHEPGALPRWLSEQGVDLVIAGGMGTRAQQLFLQYGIKSIVGAADGSPQEIAKSYMNGTLTLADNACDH